MAAETPMSEGDDLEARLRSAARSWRRTDALDARDPEAEAQLFDEAADAIARIRALEAARPADPAAEAGVGALRELFDEIGDAIAEIEVAAVHAGNEPEACGAKKALGAVAKIRTAVLAATSTAGERASTNV